MRNQLLKQFLIERGFQFRYIENGESVFTRLNFPSPDTCRFPERGIKFNLISLSSRRGKRFDTFSEEEAIAWIRANLIKEILRVDWSNFRIVSTPADRRGEFYKLWKESHSAD